MRSRNLIIVDDGSQAVAAKGDRGGRGSVTCRDDDSDFATAPSGLRLLVLPITQHLEMNLAAKREQKSTRSKREWIRFDEREDVIASLDLVRLLIPKLEREPRYWKWVILASQNALQGALVCALSGTARIGAFTKNLQSAWLDWYDTRQGPAPDEKLADFKTLLKWSADANRMHGGKPLKLTAKQIRDLHKLHDHLRNDFSHFTPKGWSIEAAGLGRMILTAIEATEFFMGQDRIRMHLSGNQIAHIEKNASAVRIAFG